MRQIKKRRYLAAFIITIFVFFFGLLFGMMMESERVDYIQGKAYEQKLDYRELQFQYQFIDQLSQENNCPVFINAINNNLKELETTRIRLTSYSEDATISKDDFELLYKDYIISQLDYWLLVKKARDLCEMDVATVLYFFSTDKECPDCNEQSFVLTYLKKRFGDNLLNFALNAEFNDYKVMQMLLDTYKVSTFPTLIIEDEKFEGFTTKNTILEQICPLYSESHEDCVNYINVSIEE